MLTLEESGGDARHAPFSTSSLPSTAGWGTGELRLCPFWLMSGDLQVFVSPLILGDGSRSKPWYDVVVERSSLAIYLTTNILNISDYM